MNRVIVYTHNGKTTVYSGWRAWLMGAAAFVVTFVVLALVTFLLLGIAASIGVFLLLLIPVALVVSGLAALFGRRQT